jgi:hypothetical protein
MSVLPFGYDHGKIGDQGLYLGCNKGAEKLRAAAAYNANSRTQIAPIARVSEAASDSMYTQSIPAMGASVG